MNLNIGDAIKILQRDESGNLKVQNDGTDIEIKYELVKKIYVNKN